MEVLKKNVGLVSNFEVYSFLKAEMEAEAAAKQEQRAAEKAEQQASGGGGDAMAEDEGEGEEEYDDDEYLEVDEQHVKEAAEKVLHYLTDGPTPQAHETLEGVQGCLDSLSNKELTKAEQLQILNNRPQTEVVLHLIVEECDERFSVEETEEMLHSISENLVGRLAEQGGGDDEEEEEDGDGDDMMADGELFDDGQQQQQDEQQQQQQRQQMTEGGVQAMADGNETDEL